MTHEQIPLFYTEDEVTAKVTEAVTASNENTEHRIQRTKDNLNFAIALDLVEVLRNQVANNDMDKTTAQDIYDTMKVKHDWAEASLTVNLYTVTVTLDGSEIAEVEIEAEDEDEACDLVRDDFTLYNADVTLTFMDGQGNEYTHEVTGVEHEMHDYQDSLEFTADEQ
jgi:phosphatidate phosphatase PAH1